jgi:hypothetical protein
MSEQPESFGSIARALSSATALLELEAAHGKADGFTAVDGLVAKIMMRALAAEPVLMVARSTRKDHISILKCDRERELIAELYGVEQQQKRGAWFFPEKVSLQAGIVSDDPCNVLIWAVLEPLFVQITLPFELRGRQAGQQSREEQIEAWESAESFLIGLGFDLRDELAVMRYGGGWSHFRAEQQLAAKQRLLAAMQTQARPEMAARFRAHEVLALIARYYGKAKNGRATRKQVLTRALQKTLSGFFGGDWLRFLNYLEEDPHPEEQIATAIAAPKLYVGVKRSAVTVAAEHRVPLEEVERVLQTFWQTTGTREAGPISPIDARLQALRQFWEHFDTIHSRQQSGMQSLWGLVEEGRDVTITWQGPELFHPQLYRTLLPEDVLSTVDRLWDSVMLPQWPDRMVSEVSPHGLMAEAFGVALRFWQGCALTAWFVCEGPSSRTTIQGLPTYHQQDLEDLEQLGCPVSSELFVDLCNAERRLGAPEPIKREVSSTKVPPYFSLEISMSLGTRRSGFEFLRDVISAHRQAWSEKALEAYLRARWEGELRAVALAHARHVADKGKAPTPKQFAKRAEPAVNHWFGGDLSALYAAIGEKSPVRTTQSALMPTNRMEFAKAVHHMLGGKWFERQVTVATREAQRIQVQEHERQRKLAWLATQSVRFLQMAEALGRLPDMNEFGLRAFQDRSDVISPDIEAAWEAYKRAIEEAKNIPAAPANEGVEQTGQATSEVIAQDKVESQNAGDVRGWIDSSVVDHP